MHSVLFVATPPKDRHQWSELTALADREIKPSKDALRLGENVWLLNLQVSAAGFGYLIVSAERLGISYGILPFERAPEWLPAGFDPSTTLARSE
jgi:hypothetical protein